MIKRKKVILASLFLLFVSANVFKVLERQSVKQDVLLTDLKLSQHVKLVLMV